MSYDTGVSRLKPQIILMAKRIATMQEQLDQIYSEFTKSGEDIQELALIIQRQFKRAKSSSEHHGNYDFVSIDGNQTIVSLKVGGKSGSLQRIEQGPGLTQNDVDTLRHDIQVEYEPRNQQRLVVRKIVLMPQLFFAPYRSSILKYQLCELPAGSPLPEEGQIGPDRCLHPCLLEFEIRKPVKLSGSFLNLQLYRSDHRQQELIHFLNFALGLVHQVCYWLDWEPTISLPLYGSRVWVLNPYLDGRFDARLAEPGYNSLTLTDAFSDEFSELGSPDGQTEVSEKATQQILELELFYQALPGELSNKFKDSTFWLYQACIAKSCSAAFLHCIQSIENLQEQSDKLCEGCGTFKESIGSVFHRFVEQYLPFYDGNAKKDLYSSRSTLAHGGAFLADSRGPGGVLTLSLNSKATEERNKTTKALALTRCILANWLRDMAVSRGSLHQNVGIFNSQNSKTIYYSSLFNEEHWPFQHQEPGRSFEVKISDWKPPSEPKEHLDVSKLAQIVSQSKDKCLSEKERNKIIDGLMQLSIELHQAKTEIDDLKRSRSELCPPGQEPQT